MITLIVMCFTELANRSLEEILGIILLESTVELIFAIPFLFGKGEWKGIKGYFKYLWDSFTEYFN